MCVCVDACVDGCVAWGFMLHAARLFSRLFVVAAACVFCLITNNKMDKLLRSDVDVAAEAEAAAEGKAGESAATPTTDATN